MADNSATSGDSKRPNIATVKAKNWGGMLQPKTSLKMRDIDALLTLVGEIIHGDPDFLGMFLTKQHDKGAIHATFANTLPSTTVHPR